jgi:hypothetical protein
MKFKNAAHVAMYPVSGFLPDSRIREPRFGPLFLEFDFHDGHSRLSWDARSTLSSKNIELLATSF